MESTRYRVAPCRRGGWLVADEHGNVFYRGPRPLQWVGAVTGKDGQSDAWYASDCPPC